jgi:hypothetical protein
MSAEEEPVVNAIVFSLLDGTVRVSWPHRSEPVELGDCKTVTYMMRDFLDQYDLGQRFALGRAASK